MSLNPVPLPKDAALVDGNQRMTKPWIAWFTDQSRQVASTSQRTGVVDLAAQSASISATALPVDAVTQGLYRAQIFLHVTRAATSSSSIQATINYTSDGIALSASTSALAGNTTTTHTGATAVFRSDNATPLTYATTYSSSGATAMQYRLYIVISKVDA